MLYELLKIEGFMNSNLKIVLKKEIKVYYIVYNGCVLSYHREGEGNSKIKKLISFLIKISCQIFKSKVSFFLELDKR